MAETDLEFFDMRIKNDTLCLLDEPENSLSPMLQLKLAKNLAEISRFCKVQLVIATHSPFLLSLEGARIYDLDSEPCEVKNWWELENTKTYYNFFKEHKDLFE